MILREYTLTLVVQDDREEAHERGRASRVLADFPAMLEEAEENLNDLLPDGFQVTIKEET